MATMTIESGLGVERSASQPALSGGDLIYRLEGELRGGAPVDTCPEGIRFVHGLDATVVAGPFAGDRLTGLDQFTIRPDGTVSLAGPQTIESGGTPVSVELRAILVQPSEKERPRPEVVLNPGYDFPDLDFRLTGSATIRTSDPRHGRFDGAIAAIEGWVNFESGELQVEARAI